MSIFMDIIQEAKNLAIGEFKKFGISLVLFEIAEQKVLELTKELNVDETIALVGYYLMDLKLGEAVSKGKREEHVEMSIEAGKKFLEKFDLDKKTKDKIINCIKAHHGEVSFICKEAEICANADAYKFLHPKGFFDFLMYFGKRNMEFKEALDFAESKVEEKYKILSLDICKKELEEYYHILKKLLKSAREL